MMNWAQIITKRKNEVRRFLMRSATIAEEHADGKLAEACYAAIDRLRLIDLRCRHPKKKQDEIMLLYRHPGGAKLCMECHAYKMHNEKKWCYPKR